ncbi:membrane protein insertion efficiency factor YidD [Candidatus Woesebacteria bacterium]|nr:membrane protein insertion efficiency factor YidD [Candidatus Woesebacteria bacterium]
MKTAAKYLFYFYSATAYIREQLLITVFGYKSHCKHTPTCSQYTHEMIQEKGLMAGVVLGARRLATCW